MNGSGPPALLPPGRRPWTVWRVLRGVAKYGPAALLDALIVSCAFVLALLLRFDGDVPPDYSLRLVFVLVAVIPTYFGVSLLLGLYWRSWRYASVHDAMVLTEAVVIATALISVPNAILVPHPVPLSVPNVAGIFALLGMGVVRFRHRLLQDLLVTIANPPRSRLLIIGAGHGGQWLARELLYTPSHGYRPVCFVDDDPEKHGQRIHGLQVLGTRHDIPRLVQQYKVEVIAFAIPSLPVEARREILVHCESTLARVKIMPGLPDLLTDQASTELFRDVRLEDLLGRAPVVFTGRQGAPVANRPVLITGAAGSIGAELARQVAAGGAERLLLLDIDESRLFDLAQELEPICAGTGTRVEIVVADVTRPQRVNRVFGECRPAVVFHAAAYKHVPLMETHPIEAVLTNVVGTYNVCVAAEEVGCRQVVFISTDKAVEPASIMGATKRVGERIAEAFSEDSATMYCAVRFGNVLGSRGSVVPIFTRQIRRGGPVTITHHEMTRYFMTIPEAVNLIIEAASQAQGGEIFILDMGEPVSIAELARKMIHLHGLRPGDDIEILETGLRPGEKLHEALVTGAEALCATNHPRVLRVAAHEGTTGRRAEISHAVSLLQRFAEAERTDAMVANLFLIAGGERALVVVDSVETRR
jgi:FlaA1/EpsC-like NDP-sugar epimerase